MKFRPIRVKRILSWWFLLCLVYLGINREFSGSEACAGLLAGGISAVAAGAFIRVTGAEFHPKFLWLGFLLRRLAGRVFIDSGLVAAAMWRNFFHGERFEGGIFTVPFNNGGEEGESAARRALVIACATLPPNTVSIKVDRKKGILVMHQMVKTGEVPEEGGRDRPA